jgi:hypothetical protein
MDRVTQNKVVNKSEGRSGATLRQSREQLSQADQVAAKLIDAVVGI